MNILVLSDGVTPFVKGGMQRHTQLMVEYLARSGEKVHLLHYFESNNPKPKKEEVFSPEALENISTESFCYEDKSRIPGHYLRAQLKMSELYLDWILKTDQRFDFIYAKGFMAWALLKKRTHHGIQTPVGVKFHGMNMFQKQANFKLTLQQYMLKSVVLRNLRLADYVFSYGGKITDILQRICITPIIEISTGIEANWIYSGSQQAGKVLQFLFVGRFDRVKGLPELYKAIRLLEKDDYEWHFHFVGPIPSQHQFKSTKCTFHGAIYDEEQLKEVYDDCDILVNTSISEGMPNVILEGMSRGLGVIATDVGATSVLVKNRLNGLLLQKPDPNVIYRALVESLESYGMVNTWKSNSLGLIRSYTWDQIAPNLTRKIEECIVK